MGIPGAITGAIGSRKAYQQQKSLTRAYVAELKKYQSQFGELNADFSKQFKDLSTNFNPYDLQAEFDSMYEAVIMPMERQFSESVLPSIRQSYSGGGYGSALFSGGRESTEAQARSQLSMNEALLKNQARESGIARNYQEYDRRRGDLGLGYAMGKEPINLGIQLAGQKYGAKTDQINAQLASTNAIGAALDSGETTVTNLLSAFRGGGTGTTGQGYGGSVGNSLMSYTPSSYGNTPNASGGGFQTFNFNDVNKSR